MATRVPLLANRSGSKSRPVLADLAIVHRLSPLKVVQLGRSSGRLRAMSEENGGRNPIHFEWRFMAEVQDAEKLKAFQLDWLSSESGELEGLVEWDSLGQQVGLRLMEVATQAWRAVEAEMGVRFVGGGWPTEVEPFTFPVSEEGGPGDA